jgi:hypothetical protein
VVFYEAGDDFMTEQERFIDNGDGTVTDREMGLMWKKNDTMIDLKKWVNGDCPLRMRWSLCTMNPFRRPTSLARRFTSAINLPVGVDFR